MALTDSNNGMIMPVAPAYGNSGFGGGFGWGDDAWLILILLFALGGWGGFGGFGGFGGGDAVMPYLWNTQTQSDVNRGFADASLSNQITGIQNAVTSGFASAEVANCGRAADAMQTAYTNQIASMNQNFANQQALDARLGSMEMAQQNCCCENRLATANLSALAQSENCSDRQALSDGVRDIIANQTAGTQRILDMMCQDKIDAKNEKIAELQAQVNMQNLASSQAAQTAQLIADNTAQTQYIVNRVAPYPIPSFTVANPYGCNGVYNYAYGF